MEQRIEPKHKKTDLSKKVGLLEKTGAIPLTEDEIRMILETIDYDRNQFIQFVSPPLL